MDESNYSHQLDGFYAPDAKFGFIYCHDFTTFRVWSPTADRITLILYREKNLYFDMTRQQQGVWEVLIDGDLDEVPYRFEVTCENQRSVVTDPYGVASTVNGEYSVVVDLSKTTQINHDIRPKFQQATDAIVYEVSVRDFTIHETAPVKHKGKFLGLAELDYLKSLGVTHIQLLPIFDFEGIDELNPAASYNWGYNPAQYNVPEGSYATVAQDPYNRVNDLKILINSLHEQGLGVVMDVVFNHVASWEVFPFEALVPGYYFRKNKDGTLTNSSGCGNDVASNHLMARKFIIDSIKFWLDEYAIDGFRFDLMGLLDIETMNQVRQACNETGKEILLYGEGWNIPSLLPEEKRATLYNADMMPNISHFNDKFRDIIKGSTFNHHDRGLVLGNYGLIYEGMKCLAGRNFSNPYQSVNYVECHDNHTFWDRANISNPQDSDLVTRKRQLLATSMVIFAQGIPFIHGGQEFFRTKFGAENSYKDSDEINAINWKIAKKHQSYINLVRGYIKIRKAHGAFRFATSDLVEKHIEIKELFDKVIEYRLKDVRGFGPWSEIRVYFNLANEEIVINEDFTGFSVIADCAGSGIFKRYKVPKELILPEISTKIIVK